MIANRAMALSNILSVRLLRDGAARPSQDEAWRDCAQGDLMMKRASMGSACGRPDGKLRARLEPFARAVLFAITVATSAIQSITPATAQTYPNRPITIMVGAAAGGTTDTIARNLAPHLRALLGQTVIVENNGVAGGTMPHGRTARAAPDGYTLSFGHTATHVFNGAIYVLPYDVLNDFEPVSLVSISPGLVAARGTLPPRDLNEFVEWLKANPDRSMQALGGIGSPDHVAGVLLQSRIGARWRFVPYRGAAPVMQELMAGHVDWSITNPDTSVPQMRAGHIKIYAVTAPQRLTMAPEIPTVDEAGLPGFYSSYWHGVWAPKRTPKDIVAKLNAALLAPWPSRRSGSALLKWARTFFRASSRRRKRSPRCRRPRSRNGGR
jgi:tripartite-type tricarboxylate transporter receptor subunit TctC